MPKIWKSILQLVVIYLVGWMLFSFFNTGLFSNGGIMLTLWKSFFPLIAAVLLVVIEFVNRKAKKN